MGRPKTRGGGPGSRGGRRKAPGGGGLQMQMQLSLLPGVPVPRVRLDEDPKPPRLRKDGGVVGAGRRRVPKQNSEEIGRSLMAITSDIFKIKVTGETTKMSSSPIVNGKGSGIGLLTQAVPAAARTVKKAKVKEPPLKRYKGPTRTTKEETDEESSELSSDWQDDVTDGDDGASMDSHNHNETDDDDDEDLFAAMDDMVPIEVKTTAEEVHRKLVNRVLLAGKGLTWWDFVKMFIDEPEIDKYLLRGEGNTVLDLKSSVGSYVRSCVETPWPYIVHVSKKEVVVEGWGESSLSSSAAAVPKQLLDLDTDKDNKVIVPMATEAGPVDVGGKGKRMRVMSKKKKAKGVPTGRRKRTIGKNASEEEFENHLQGLFGEEDEDTTTTGTTHLVHGGGLLLASQQQPPPRRSGSSSGSDDPPLPALKPHVIDFVRRQVPNKYMLKIREELMALRDNEDYFKLTALTPLAAGLLEQMLCRHLPEVVSNKDECHDNNDEVFVPVADDNDATVNGG